ncbi:amino acid/polyamine transporter I [Talaromyces proteolyticus]|uniref:Amino acid/polyamine transporter I n=1 Tax=Talaromyces proteolyticus TaxID=1131652 RepID=A0AAD4KXB1_9EURO|nr:amino acid/polyamine transporter I [Talaromyces proteolyticus]KAH8698943.1 amino acid/polyamine transporter I [Talaromyces proteolyticus]
MVEFELKQSTTSTKPKDIDDTIVPTSSIDIEGKIVNLDERRLRAQGHEAQLERSFTWLGASALAYSICNPWLSYASFFGLVLAQGGGQTAMFSILVGAVVQWIIFLGGAEFCSALPSSGGPYHFAYVVAPQKTRNFAAYMTGFLNILAWLIGTSSGTIYTAISAFGCATIWFPDFAQERYQVYLCYLGVIIISLIPICTIPQKYLDKWTKSCMALSLIGMFTTIGITLGMGRGHYSSGSIFVDFKGITGWSPGTGWLLAIANSLYCYAGNGSVIHLAEEIPDPGRKLPQIINMAMLMGVILVIPWIVALLYCIQDIEAVQTSFLPSLEVFAQITRSKSAAIGLQAFMTLLYYTCIPSQWITCSRLIWAFARDNGLPFSSYWQHVDSKLGIPWRTTLLSASFCAIYGALYVASSTAYNSIINTNCLLLNIAYVIPQAILLIEGRSKLPNRDFNLGKLGYPINICSVLLLILIGVLFCMPQTNPTTVGSMNYNTPVLLGLFILICLFWLERRKKFSGPDIDWDMLDVANTVQ